MIDRFLLIKDSVFKALIDFKSDISFTDTELQHLKEISESLNIIKATVEAICEEDANLLTADTALRFMIQKLSQKDSIISNELLVSLKRRISQRRVVELIGTMTYLHNPHNFYEQRSTHDCPFENPSNECVRKTIVKIISTFFDTQQPDQTVITSAHNTQDTEGCSSSTVSVSIKTQIREEIIRFMSQPSSAQRPTSSTNDLDTTIRVEMALFDENGQRSRNLEKVYNLLLSIPPTSVEAERVFSATGYLCNHLRTSMKEDSLDSLSFLRSYYQNLDKK